MFSKLKQWIVENNLIPLAVIVIAFIISSIIGFLVYFKLPINLNNKDDYKDIENLIADKNPGKEITNIEMISGIVYRELNDTIYSMSNKIKTEDDIATYTKIIKYDVIDKENNDTLPSITIFEIKEVFMKEKVGKHLITINNFRK